jgi:hypothetical protein
MQWCAARAAQANCAPGWKTNERTTTIDILGETPMSLLSGTRFWQRSKKASRRPRPCEFRLHCEPLESRKMLALLGVVPQFPIIAYDNSGVAAYSAAAETFDATATPLSFKASIPAPPRPITNPRDVEIHIRVDNSGNLLGGVAGDDLRIEGNVDLDGNPSTTGDNLSGVLLTGEILDFGFLEAGVTDQFDFRFIPTGGALASFWAGKDIGITMNSENSTFGDDFTVDFGGGAKGNIGAIEPLPGPILGSIIVDKVTDPSGDPTSFSFSTTGAGYAGFSLADADAPNEQQVAPGTYTVSEFVPAGWDLADLTIVDPTGDSSAAGDVATLVVGPGETILVTFTDTKRGQIIVDKVTDPSGDPTSFSFSTTGAGYSSFSLTDAAAPNDQQLVPGIYSITELVPTGWDLSSLSMVDPSNDSSAAGDTATLTLGAGETILVTFTDTKRGRIIVDKVTDPSGDPTSFSFSATGTGYASFSLTDAAAPNDQELLPGTYSIAEIVPAGWNLTSLTVVDPTSDSSTAANVATLLLGAGETILVTFTDTRVSSSISGTKWHDETGNGLTPDDTGMAGVKIYLDTNNNGSHNSGEPFVLSGPDGTYSFTDLDAGTYTVREVVPADYVRTAPTLTDKYTITLTTGQSSSGNDFANAESCDCYDVTDVVYIVDGTTAVTNLRDNTNEGDTVEVTFTIPDGQAEHQFTLVSYTAPGPTFVAADAWMQEIFDIDSDVFGPGTHTLTVTIPHSFYQIDFVCGAAIDMFGPAGSNIFYSAQKRLISADNDGTHAVLANPSQLSGFVYVDVDNNGEIDLNDRTIPGAKVTLTGTSSTGQSISQTSITDTDGMYYFDNLPEGAYTITETQPSGYIDGQDSVGTLGGNLLADKFTVIPVAAGEHGMNYNFGEQRATGSTIGDGQTATIGFWNGKNGQNLIKALNGSQNSKNLGNYLAQLMPNVYGANAGSNKLAGKTNAEVAKFYQSMFKKKGTKIDAQVMAVALATYVTKSSLAGNVATSYGFTVTTNGVGTALVDVGDSGAAFGLENDATITVLELLQRVNDRARKGKLWDLNGNGSYNAAETILLKQAYDLLEAINEAGDIG